MNIAKIKRGIIGRVASVVMTLALVISSVPAPAFASFTPGQTSDPNCLPTDSNCNVVISNTGASLSAPTSVTVTPTGTAGVTTYSYRVSSVDSTGGETVPTTATTTIVGNATLSATNYNAVSWSAVSGANHYRVYGRTSGSELFIASTTATSYLDTGATTPSGAAPTSNTTGAISGNTLSITGNGTFGGALSVSGTSTLTSLLVTGTTTLSGALMVTGTSTLAALSTTGAATFTGTLTSSAQGFTLASSTPTATTNTLYNEGGTLKWNGYGVQTALDRESNLLASWDGRGDPTVTGNSFPLATLSGNATYDATNKHVRLTSAVVSQNGRIEWDMNPGNAMKTSFEFRAGGGTGADSTWFYVYNTSSPISEDATSGGYIIALDEFGADTIQVKYNGTLLGSVSPGNIDDNAFHRVDIVIENARVDVFWDGKKQISVQDQLGRDISGTRMGFGARTGGATDNHDIRNLEVVKSNSDYLFVNRAIHTTTSTAVGTSTTSFSSIYTPFNLGIGTTTSSSMLAVSGSTFLDGALTVSGQSTLGNASTTGFTASGLATLATAKISGALNASSTLMVTGATTLYGAFTGNSAATSTLAGGLSAANIATAGYAQANNLVVTGAATSTFTGGLSAANIASVGYLQTATAKIGTLSGILFGTNGTVGTTSLSSLTTNGLSFAGNTLTSVVNGVSTTTSISYANATTDGILSTTTQAIAGNKTFSGILNVSGTSTIRRSETTSNTAPTSVLAAGYLALGGLEFGLNSYRLMGFGYNDNTATKHYPAYIGYQENATAGDTTGDLVFLTRATNVGSTTPLERMRITSGGSVTIGTGANAGTLTVVGAATLATTTATVLTITGQTTLGNASTTGLTTSGLATLGSAKIGSLQGLLFGTAGSVGTVATSTLGIALSDTTGILAINRGGTGTSTAPTYGKLLVGNSLGGYDLLATSTLGLTVTPTTINGASGPAFTFSAPYGLTIATSTNTLTFTPNYASATADGIISTSTQTIAGAKTFTGTITLATTTTTGISVTQNGITLASSTPVTTTQTLYNNAGTLYWNGSAVGGGSLTGTQGQIAYFSGTNTAVGTSTLFISSTGNVGIGTTTPGSALSVSGDISGTGGLTVGANTTLGDATTDRLSVTAQISGASPLTFQGATDDGFTTALLFTDPTANNVATFQNASGTVAYLSNVLAPSLTDNVTDSFDLQEGANNYLNIDTTNGSENISFGNATTNPSFSFLGTGAATLAGNLAVNGGTINSTGALTINSNSTNALTLDSGTTGAVNIGNNTNGKAINIGGTGANTIAIGNTQTAGSVNVGALMTTGTITIGGTGLQTGTIGIGTGTGVQTLNFGTGTGSKFINIGGTGSNTINIGTTQTTGAITIGGTGAHTGTIGIGTGTGVQTLNFGTGGTGSKTINIGTGAIGNIIAIGNASGATSLTLNSGTGAINIGTSIAKTITLGNATGATGLVLNSGTAGMNFDSGTLFVDSVNNRVGFGTVTPAQVFAVTGAVAGTGGIFSITNTDTTSGNTMSYFNVAGTMTGAATLLKFDRQGVANLGTITKTNAADSVAYNTTSDQRLKEDTGEIAKGLSSLMGIKVHNFKWLNGGMVQDGFFAQELADIVPEAVTVGSDERNAEGNLVTPWGVDYGKLTPIIVQSMQDLAGITFGGSANNLLALNFPTEEELENGATTPTIEDAKSALEEGFGETLKIVGDDDTVTEYDNAFEYLATKVLAGTKIIKEFMAQRVVAVEGYFKRIFANELCLTDSNGAVVCVTGDQLKTIGGSSSSNSDTNNPSPDSEPTPDPEPAALQEAEQEQAVDTADTPAEPDVSETTDEQPVDVTDDTVTTEEPASEPEVTAETQPEPEVAPVVESGQTPKVEPAAEPEPAPAPVVEVPSAPAEPAPSGTN